MESFKAKTGRSKINHNASFKAKFCPCFKPVSSVDDAFEPRTLSTIFSSALMADCREGTEGWRHSSKKKGDDNGACFWQILKKAFNDTTLVKKIKTRKAANKSKISRSSSDVKLEQKFEKNSKEECNSTRSPLESSNSRSLFTRSSLSSLANSSSSSQTLGSSSSPSASTATTLSFTPVKHPKLRDKKKGTNPDEDNSNKALCYILVTSLLILILWGKVFAVLCVSFWLYLFPRRRELDEPPGPAYREEEEFDMVEYKKKVIMEGLLERNRSRLISMDSIARPCAFEA